MSVNIIIRTDASNMIGTGHVMRCLTLAEQLMKANAQTKITVISRDLPGNLSELIKSKGFDVKLLEFSKEDKKKYAAMPPNDDYAKWLGVKSEQDAQEVLEVITSLNLNAKIDLLIIDHYALDISWETSMRNFVQEIFVFDDTCKSHNADFLLNQNIFADPAKYKNLVPKSCRLLCGVSHALIRDEFLKFRQENIITCRNLSNPISILVTLGGVDVHNILTRLVNFFSGWDYCNYKLTIISGQSNKYYDSLRSLVENNSRISLVKSTNNIASLMSMCDIAICAGGATSIELLYMRVPSICMILADNQEMICQRLHQLNLMRCVGSYNDNWEEKLSSYLKYVINNYQKVISDLKNLKVADKNISNYLIRRREYV
jgi:UDP-2,4-diacetamido-2,4,6-trideoxy-beta-L-altropyranose hydrolase